ncbi:MAG TPA: ABC transporter permease, partial [Candidatus Acidoferrum sp.]|nr:ABC transporter permease [Candidatus Acidoferrum sp.]
MATRHTIQVAEQDAISAASSIQQAILRAIKHVQDYSILCGHATAAVFSAPHYAADLLNQMDNIGVGSMPIVVLTGFFIGAVMVLNTASQFSRFGQTALTGEVVALALVRELGPTITGLLAAGRNSSGIASELGSMIVTEQVDAMRAMGTDPIRKLVTPRVVAAVLMVPLLTAMSDFIGLVGGFVVGSLTLHLGAVQFWRNAVNSLQFSDLMEGLVKPLVFGFIVASVGCYQG